MQKKEINIVWFKRDLRLTDHEPLFTAQQNNLPILLLYCFEPSVMSYPDADVRHWRFVYESLQALQNQLHTASIQLYVFHQEAAFVFEELAKNYKINSVFSHQETGNALTFNRDKNIQLLFAQKGITWHEFQTNGVIRKLKSRELWEEKWKQTMSALPKLFDPNTGTFLNLETSFYEGLKGQKLPEEITTRNKNFQQGGEYWAWRYLDSFIKERYVNYSKHISKPSLSRKGCSRLSPYLAYGNISMRMVYQYTM